jgi:hypothetical protein
MILLKKNKNEALERKMSTFGFGGGRVASFVFVEKKLLAFGSEVCKAI